MTVLAVSDFRDNLVARVDYIYSKKGLLLPQNISFDLSAQERAATELGSGYDSFVNIRATKLKNDLNSIAPGGQNYDATNSNEVELNVYDLNSKTKIYSQKVVGYSTRTKSKEDVHFVASSPILIVGAYKKIMKDINKKSTS